MTAPVSLAGLFFDSDDSSDNEFDNQGMDAEINVGGDNFTIRERSFHPLNANAVWPGGGSPLRDGNPLPHFDRSVSSALSSSGAPSRKPAEETPFPPQSHFREPHVAHVLMPNRSLGPGTYVLAEWMLDNLPLFLNKRVLELGSATGALSLFMVRACSE